MKKIPFDLERAIAGDLCVDENGVEYKLVYQSFYSPNQHLFIRREPSIESSVWLNVTHDKFYLSMKPKKKTYWANVYKQPLNNNPIFVSHVYSSWEEAEDNKNPNRFIKTISFELEE